MPRCLIVSKTNSFKWSNDSDRYVFIYHNTCWTDREEHNAMSIWSPIHNVVMRNNIFRGTRYAFESTASGLSGHDWDYDNWYTTRGEDEPHFKWENVRYDTIDDLCAASGLECNGHELEPGLADPPNDEFGLDASSPNREGWRSGRRRHGPSYRPLRHMLCSSRHHSQIPVVDNRNLSAFLVFRRWELRCQWGTSP